MPWYQFKMETPYSVLEVCERVQQLTRAPPDLWQAWRESFGRRGNHPPFLGNVAADGFRIRRDIRYRNSFLPLIRGHIESAPTGSVVHVTMSLHPAVVIFMAVWLSIAGSAGWKSLVFSDGPLGPMRFIPVGMIVFALVMTVGGFVPETIKAKRLLIRALGRPVT